MKRLSFILISLFLICVSSSAKINPEDYGNIRVDTIWWEGPTYRHYSKMVHMRVTNIGDKQIEGSVWVNDKYNIDFDSYGDPSPCYYTLGSVQLSLMPNETKDYTFRFMPYYDLIPEGETRNIAHLCLTTEDTDDEIFCYDIEFERTNRINANCTISISDVEIDVNSGVDYTKKENVLTISDDLPVFEWTYTNLEDFPIFDILAMSIYTTKYNKGEFEPLNQIGGDIIFPNIDKGETVNGTYVPESLFTDGEYYMVYLLYGLFIDDPFFGTMWRNIRFASDPFVFKVDLSSGIKDVNKNIDDKPVYTLGGVRVTDTVNLPKGIYIRDGKKFVVK